MDKNIHDAYIAPVADNNKILLNDTALKREYLSTFRHENHNYTVLFFRAPKRNYSYIIANCITQKLMKPDNIYSVNSLPLWTQSIRIRALNSTSMGRVFEGVKARLGLYGGEVKFCIDGFYGLAGYGNIFGKKDGVPWMEISNMSTVSSLKLKSGDSVFVSLPSIRQIDNVAMEREKIITGIEEEQRRKQKIPDPITERLM